MAFVGGILFKALETHPVVKTVILVLLSTALIASVHLIQRMIAHQSRTALQNPLHIGAQGLFDDLFDPMLQGLILLLR